MSPQRITDLVLLLAHTLQCQECRSKVLEEPERVLIGRKIPEEMRQKLAELTAGDFENSMTLANSLGLDPADLLEGYDHPRARLRHL